MLHHVGYHATLQDVPRNSWAYQLVEFQSRLDSFRSASPPRTAIFGPSYALQIPPINGVHQLGLTSGRQKELYLIARAHFDKSDTVLYIVTIRDVSSLAKRPTRWTLVCEPLRKATIGHAVVRNKLKRSSEPISKRKSAKLSRNAIIASNRKLMPLWCRDGIDIGAFKTFQTDFPKTLFVLHPIFKYIPPSDVGALDREFRQQFVEASLPILDLVDVADPADFKDICHLNREGVEKVRLALSTHLATLSASDHQQSAFH